MVGVARPEAQQATMDRFHIGPRHRPPSIPPSRESKECQGAVNITTPIRADHPALANGEEVFVIGGK